MRTALDFPEKALHDIVGADRLPMLFGKGVEGQTRLQIALQTRDRRWIDGSVLFTKGCHGLISRLPILLIEQGFQLWFELLLLLGGHVAEPRCPSCAPHSADEPRWEISS